MKKTTVLLMSVALFFVFVLNIALAEFIVTPIPINCSLFGSCAIYVDDDADSAVADGTAAFPFDNITEAVNLVKTNQDYNTIMIAKGAYSPTATGEVFPWSFSDADLIKPDLVNIYGGYSPDFSQRDTETYPTLIEMEANPGLIGIENIAANIEGLHISGAESWTWGVSGIVDIENTDPSTSYNVNIGYNVFNDNSTAFVTPNIYVNLDGSNTASVYNNDFTLSYNYASPTVSMVGDASFYNNYFYRNTATSSVKCSDGGFIYNNYITSAFVDRVIKLDGGCTFVHNTVIDNTIVQATDSYAVITTDNDGNMVANNLITNNTGNETYYQFPGDSSTFEYNALYGNDSDPSPLVDNNVVCDPLYPATYRYSPADAALGEGSECIDKGKSISTVAVDIFDVTRPLDGDGDGTADYDPGGYEGPTVVIVVPVTLEITDVGVIPNTFSPDGDGIGDTTTLTFTISDDADVDVNIEYEGDPTYKILLDAVAKTAGVVTVDWDGMDSGGDPAENGTYTFLIEVSGTGGSDSHSVDVIVLIDTSGESCAGYVDVLAAHPDCDAIEYMQSIGAMTGNPDGTFAPDDYLQRDQVAKISLETFGLFDDSEDYCGGVDPFPDVNSSDWAYQHICRGFELEMIYGYTGGEDAGYYRPARSVNRVEFLALVLRNVSDTMPDDSLGSYDDVDGGHWFSGYAKYSYDNALFDGNKLFPSQVTTRLEVARHVYELFLLGKI